MRVRKQPKHSVINEALSIQDRILAAKFKVVSEILECLTSPETTISGCLSFLNKPHSLPAVREIFSVYLNDGVKSMLNKAKQVENVKSVMFINYVLYKFVWKFSSKPSFTIVWPTIQLPDRNFNPVLNSVNWCAVSTRKSWGGELIQPTNVLSLDEEIGPYLSAVTGRREIVACDGHGDIKVISSTGESKLVNLPYPKEGEVIGEDTFGVTSDSNNNVYVVKYFRMRTETDGDVYMSYVLFVLDENYDVKHDCVLHFIRYSMKIFAPWL